MKDRRQEEFERVVMPHSRSLLRVARRLTSGSSHAASTAAEDLVQESLLLAWRGYDQFLPGTNARAWLFRIFFNSFHSAGRKARASPVTIPLSVSARAESKPPDEALELRRALDSLDIDQREVLLLGVVEGFTCREIAGLLEIPIGTVMSRQSRGRLALRALLTRRNLLQRENSREEAS